MKHLWNRKYLPLSVALLGCAAYVLRKLLYALAVDWKNLLVSDHPLDTALTILTYAVLVFIAAAVWKLDGSADYGDNFSADLPAAVGHILGAAGIAMTMLTTTYALPGGLTTCWRILGYAAPVCLVAAAFARAQGKQPNFLLYLAPCLYLMFHVVCHYRLWSSNPQFQDYGFALFGAIALMFFLYYTAAFSVGAGKRRMQLFMGLSAMYLCLASAAVTEYPYLYLGGMGLAATGLCTLYPKPKQEPEDPGKDHEA